ncbi:hypothetical protein GOBAR_AA14418 [Gossypium barbadense]|uniref:Uncharacterized protein n=1 Tax=Gossypium barbadense TaxID=3634 RepID=A0A2P5XSA3_GOSBA|nr:hypothetical protein GOBAR_AA14418 [Gossypium barbadense]
MDKCVTEDINIMLVRDFMDDEILDAFNQMDLGKAPEIGGLSSCFFKENWEVVGKELNNSSGMLIMLLV